MFKLSILLIALISKVNAFHYMNDFQVNELAVHSRHKRAFIPLANGTRFQIEPKLTIPIPEVFEGLEAEIEIIFPNIEYFLYSSFTARSPSLEQSSIFEYIKQGLDKIGVDGSACLRRTICEMHEVPNHSLGLIGDIADILLDVPTHENEIESSMDGYRLAKEVGRQGKDCRNVYSSCPISVFNL